jgi:hypothetical protein
MPVWWREKAGGVAAAGLCPRDPAQREETTGLGTCTPRRRGAHSPLDAHACSARPQDLLKTNQMDLQRVQARRQSGTGGVSGGSGVLGGDRQRQLEDLGNVHVARLSQEKCALPSQPS